MKKGSKIVVGLVFAHWCGHCKQLMPEWNAMAKQMKMHKNKYEVYEIEDSDKDTKLDKLNKMYSVHIEIDGFPTIFKIKNGHLSYYKGERKMNPMQKWVGGENGSINERDHNSIAPSDNEQIAGGKRKTKKSKRSTAKKTKNSRKLGWFKWLA